jgi:hypothetical protein
VSPKESGAKGGRAAYGERKASSKLTDKAVLEIRASTLTRAELAKLHGVYPQTISDVRNRVSWTHVP